MTGLPPVSGGGAWLVPARVSMASEQFSGLIDFLLPRARADYADLDALLSAMRHFLPA